MSSRWAERLEALLDDTAAPRARARGAALLQAGRVGDLRVTAGRVEGRVQGTKATPLPVAVAVAVLDDAAWTRVAATLAAQVRHRARLLAGQVPEALDAELAGGDVSLLPDRLTPTCPSDPPSLVCEHVAALWTGFTRAVQDDPFVLLRLRGRGRERLLAEVAAAGRRTPERAAGEVDPATLEPGGWTRARATLDDLDLPLPRPPATDAGALRLRGDPPGWAGGVSAAELLGPLVAQAAAWVQASHQPPRESGPWTG